ncbi:riboflavin biosynthesis protein RibD domain-containing protein [Brachybacterium phenoliresistens]|uniref:Riboflavin biosynthesis protein RibD domain-containing protein n=1 Tax=Brachybacterium phenoliresistens TaxID=396014 RepID=Z9JUU2_9MICO|nr:dihydrofolate reductase family protein [Brachybacterium phenoliresistens]EWS82145.1 riboflavin biosynthesis protein RibD domain-containing protein [Brachybacterium phenoliresistens]
MRPLILRHSLSLDGYSAPPPGMREDLFPEYDEDEEFIAHMAALLGSAGVHAMGARTYRDMAGHWPFQDGPEAEAMNSIPKVVFSRSPLDTPWARTTVCSGDLATEVARLKAEHGGPILAHGGVRLAQALVRGDLVDEYHLLVGPFAYGGGSPLFPEVTRLKLIDVRKFPKGNLALRYSRPDAVSS